MIAVITLMLSPYVFAADAFMLFSLMPPVHAFRAADVLLRHVCAASLRCWFRYALLLAYASAISAIRATTCFFHAVILLIARRHFYAMPPRYIHAAAFTPLTPPAKIFFAFAIITLFRDMLPMPYMAR